MAWRVLPFLSFPFGVTVETDAGKSGKPGVFMDFYEHGKLREFCATSGKFLTNKII